MPIMERILEVNDLAAWTQREIPSDHPYANLLCDAVTVLINTEAFGFNEDDWKWTKATAPSRVKDIAGLVGKRNLLNPTQVVNEGSIGPIGGDTYAKEFAAGMFLTESEKAEIRRLAGLPDQGANRPGLMSIMATSTGRGYREGPIYVTDSSGSDKLIPFVDPSQDTFYRPVD